MDYATREQPKPNGSGADIGELVRSDIDNRIKKGVQTYGQRLSAHNGRDALLDAYHEALDLAMYLRQALAERDARI